MLRFQYNCYQKTVCSVTLTGYESVKSNKIMFMEINVVLLRSPTKESHENRNDLYPLVVWFIIKLLKSFSKIFSVLLWHAGILHNSHENKTQYPNCPAYLGCELPTYSSDSLILLQEL